MSQITSTSIPSTAIGTTSPPSAAAIASPSSAFPASSTSAASTSSAPSASAASASASASTNGPGGALDKNAFLKLMMIQLQHQDPLNPSDPTQYLSQLAQFSTLEQTTNIAEASSMTAAEQHTVAALALLGHSVTYIDAKGNTVTGVVQKVDFTSSGPALTVDGISGIDPGSVNEVS